MPKPRNKENANLPKGWRFKHNAYYYRVPVGQEKHWDGKKEFRLGKTLAESYVEFGQRQTVPDKIYKISMLLQKYHNTIVSLQAVKTQHSKKRSMDILLPVIGEMNPEDLEPTHVYEMLDLITKKHGQSTARIIYAYLSHVYTKAIEWGVVKHHPIKGRVSKPKPSSRDRYVEDWELSEALSVAPDIIKAHIYLKLVTGIRKSDILTLRLDEIFKTPAHVNKCRKSPDNITIDDLREGGLHLKAAKTQNSSGKKIRITWKPQVIDAIIYALKINKCNYAQYLIVNRTCDGYFIERTGEPSGFNSAWARWMKLAIKKTKLEQTFQEKDIRAKVGSDMKSLKQASELLGHTSKQTTENHYRRKGQEVEPAVINESILHALGD